MQKQVKILSRDRHQHPRSQVISVIIKSVTLIFDQVNFKGGKKALLDIRRDTSQSKVSSYQKLITSAHTL